MARTRRRHFTPFERYPALLLAHALGRPTVRLVERLGLGPRVYAALHRRFRDPRRMARAFHGYVPTGHDVLVCTFIKSGTHWITQMALQIAHRGGATYDHLGTLVPWPEEIDAGMTLPLADETPWRTSPSGLRVLMTHLPAAYVPYTPDARYICVIRDPKEVFVSTLHHFRSVHWGPMGPSVASWLENSLSADCLYGSWAEHLKGYWEQRHRPNVLVLTFREMKEDLPGTVRCVADFMGVSLTSGQLADVTRQCSFEHMRAIDHKFYPGPRFPWAEEHGRIVRRGATGGSSELLTPEQQEGIDGHWRRELRRLGCDFPYDQAFGAVALEAREPLHCCCAAGRLPACPPPRVARSVAA